MTFWHSRRRQRRVNLSGAWEQIGMLNRNVNLLTALLIGVISLVSGVFLTSVALRTYLRSAAPADSISAPLERTVTLSSLRDRRAETPVPGVSGKVKAQKPSAAPAVEPPPLIVQERTASAPAPQVEAPKPAPAPRVQRSEGRGDWKRGKEDKDEKKDKREGKKRGKGKKHGRGGGNDDD